MVCRFKSNCIYEEITANTESGKFAGALGVKEGFEQLTNSLNSKFVLISGIIPSSTVCTIEHNIGHVPHILSAEIQLSSGVWSDMRIYNDKFINIAVDSKQLRVDRNNNTDYANYMVRFLLMK